MIRFSIVTLFLILVLSLTVIAARAEGALRDSNADRVLTGALKATDAEYIDYCTGSVFIALTKIGLQTSSCTQVERDCLQSLSRDRQDRYFENLNTAIAGLIQLSILDQKKCQQYRQQAKRLCDLEQELV